MNKNELIAELKAVKKKNSLLLSDNAFLLKQQREIKAYAEKEINVLMPFKHQAIRLEDKNKTLINEINMLKKVKQSGK